MTTFAAALVLLALPARAQKPAHKPAQLPDAPSAARPAPVMELDADARQKLNDAIFLPKVAVPMPTFEESQRLRPLDDEKWVGHKDVTAQADALPPQMRRFDGFGQPETGVYSRSKTESVELSFLQPAPGVTVGVGYSERKEWLGSYRTPTQTAGFAVLRITLGPTESKPTVFLPEARVSKRNDFQGEKVDHYSIDDLPPGLRP